VCARAVLANRNIPNKLDVFSGCRHLLEKFHSAKNNWQAQAAICRLWRPILWRHLSAASEEARHNAAEMLFDAYPLEDPGGPVEEKAAGAEEQHKFMKELLVDPDVDVRMVAIRGVCRVLSIFWPLLAANFVSDVMRTLITELAFDASTAKVRTVVLKGLQLILGHCKRSHV